VKILIVEEGLDTYHGHYFQYLKDLAGEARQLGHHIDVLGYRDMLPCVAEKVGSVPWLRKSVRRSRLARNIIYRIYQVILHNQSIYTDLTKWACHSPYSYDFTIFTSVRLEQLLAIGALAHCERTNRLGKLIALFIDAPGHLKPNGGYHFPLSSMLLRHSLRLISILPSSKRISFAAESKQMVRQFKAFSGFGFIQLPHVTIIPDALVWRGHIGVNHSSKLRLGAFGFSRYDKGFDILQDAISLLPRSSQHHVEYVIQWIDAYRLPSGSVAKPDFDLARQFGIQFISSFNDSHEYYAWLSKTDVVVLPYRKAFYSDRMSRVAVDAALAGIPTIFPKETWLDEFHGVYGSGVSFVAEDPVSLSSAIVEVIRDHHLHTMIASRRIDAARRAFSAEAFLSALRTIEEGD